MSLPTILSPDEIRQAKWEQLQRAKQELAKRKLTAFAEYVDHNYKTANHIEFLESKLNQVERYIETKGKEGIGRLMISMPPRSSKSLTISQMWPAYMLGRHDWLRFILCAHTQDLASDFSRVIRNTVKSSTEYAELFPETIIDDDSSSVERWHVLGNRDPAMIAVGVGGAITGRGAHIILIDDVVKSRKEADSPTYRESIKAFYRGTLRTRLEPHGAIVATMTRWHEDDLFGWLQEQASNDEGEKWEVVNLPAIAEYDGDILGRKIGEPLWPERFDFDTLMALKRGVGLYEWESQYQGHPKPPEGSKINISHFQYVDTAPDGLEWKRYWDLALSVDQSASFTASVMGAFDDEMNFYLQKMIRVKKEWADVEPIMINTIVEEDGVEQGIEKKMHGLAVMSQFSKDHRLTKRVFRGIDVDKGKLERALPWISRLEIGKVFLVKSDWTFDFLEECRNFTGEGDKFDDQIDAVSGVYDMLANPKWKKIKFLSVSKLKPKVLQPS